MPADTHLTASCICGRVALDMAGAPIVSLICYCDDCQAAARRIEARPAAPAVQGLDGGTAYVVYRKDRVQTTKGADLLEAFKLRPASPTNRVIASCCNTAMFLGFDDSKHWIDIYRARIGAIAPAPQMRVCTKFAPDTSRIPADLPRHAGYPFRLIAKLIGARIGMLFG